MFLINLGYKEPQENHNPKPLLMITMQKSLFKSHSLTPVKQKVWFNCKCAIAKVPSGVDLLHRGASGKCIACITVMSR